MDAAPLPPSFGVHRAPDTAWHPGPDHHRSVLIGGRPRRRIAVAPAASAAIDALLRGRPVGEAGPQAGLVARRLLEVGAACPAPPPGGPSPAEIAAVVPARNAAGTLRTVLAGIADVGEVVVVDDGSTDDTAAVARQAGATVVTHRQARGPAAARNAGIHAVERDVVLLVDADAEPDPGWLPPLLAHLADPATGGAAPRVRSPQGTTALARYEAAAGPLDLGEVGGHVRPDGAVPFVSTTALLLRRSAWREVGGFAEDLHFGEDLDLAWRLAELGRPLVYEPAVTVWHRHRARLGDHLTNRFRYATAGGALARRHGRHPRAALAPPALVAAAGVATLGARRTGLALGLAGTAHLALQLHWAGVPQRDAVEHAARGAVAAGRGLAAAVSRPWLPVALAVALANPRARLPVGAAALARSLSTRRRSDPTHPLASWVALRFLDDLAASAGTFRGCVTAGDLRPLLPASPPEPAPSSSILGDEVVV